MHGDGQTLALPRHLRTVVLITIIFPYKYPTAIEDILPLPEQYIFHGGCSIYGIADEAYLLLKNNKRIGLENLSDALFISK